MQYGYDNNYTANNNSTLNGEHYLYTSNKIVYQNVYLLTLCTKLQACPLYFALQTRILQLLIGKFHSGTESGTLVQEFWRGSSISQAHTANIADTVIFSRIFLLRADGQTPPTNVIYEVELLFV